MTDLQPIKNQLIGLSYEDKIQLSEWLHTQIDFERGEAVKAKAALVGNKIDSFLDKASKITKTAGNNLMDQFKSATSKDTSKITEGENKQS